MALFRLGEAQLGGVGVVVEQLAVTAPVDGGVEPGRGFVHAERTLQEVEEESFVQGAALCCFQGPHDGPYQRRTGGCGGGELLQRTVDAACRLARRQPPADAVGWLPGFRDQAAALPYPSRLPHMAARARAAPYQPERPAVTQPITANRRPGCPESRLPRRADLPSRCDRPW